MHVTGTKQIPGNAALVSDDGSVWTMLQAMEPPDVDAAQRLLGPLTVDALTRIDSLRRIGGAATINEACEWFARDK